MKNAGKKLKIGILFGGKSTEHEVSIKSATNIMAALDKAKYEIVKIKIEKSGKFNLNLLKKVDVVFPVLHGSFGEDGTMQGFLKILEKPFVGPSVLGSAVGFDKDVTKRLLTEAGIPNTKFLTFRKNEKINFAEVKENLNLPMIVKPANAGSSVGISKVSDQKEFEKAVKFAFKFDNKIIIEKFLADRREIECAVLGNEKPKASVCGEVITNKQHAFYSYEAKYLDEKGAELEILAKISKETQKNIQDLAVRTFKTLECEGLSRVDFFLMPDGEILVNEINTIPGFTNISMYPTLWKNTGISYSKLIDKLINLAIERFKKEQKLQTSIKIKK
ncbi:MAG TPA: D-alanine--D-alanine ligase family protein [Candidatus Paceibacterota bacterium]|nr:D-alanine--D-alanine ligase family protein [Candidatus Paceibacterota bacterium]